MAIYLSKVLNYWRDLKGTCKRLSPKMTETTTESEQRHHLGPWSWILRTWLVRDSWLIHADPIYNMDYNMLQVITMAFFAHHIRYLGWSCSWTHVECLRDPVPRCRGIHHRWIVGGNTPDGARYSLAPGGLIPELPRYFSIDLLTIWLIYG